VNPRNRIRLIGGAVIVVIALGLIGASRSGTQVSQNALPKAVLSVTTVKPQQLRWPVTLTASGSIVAWQEAIIGAETGGLRITALYADVGATVRRGQLLAELASDAVQADVRRYEAAVASAKASLVSAKANADRARIVKGSGAISDQQVTEYLAAEQTAQAAVDLAEAQLAAQKVTLSQTRIVAIDDGVVISRSALLGQVVSSGSELYRVQRQGRLEWQAEVDAKQLGKIKTGANVALTLPSGKALQGTVRLAAPTLSTSTGRANVFVTLPAGATAGMFASGIIEAGQQQSVLAVPEATVVLRDGLSYVYEISADKKAIRHKVGIGQHRDGLVEITDGVSAGMRLAASGGAFLADGDQVSVAKEVQ